MLETTWCHILNQREVMEAATDRMVIWSIMKTSIDFSEKMGYWLVCQGGETYDG